MDHIGAAPGHLVPLQVEVLFHPSSVPARELALHLYRLLNGPSTDLGPRIPVRFGETGADGVMTRPTLTCERTLIVVLVDARMARGATSADRATADAWARLIDELLAAHPPDTPGACAVVPVAMDAAAFALSERLHDRSFVRLDANDRRHLEFHVVIGCLRLLHGRSAAEVSNRDVLPSSDVEIFLSHAKRDLPREAWRGATAALRTALSSLPLKAWYDSAQIPAGAEFDKHITDAVKRVVAVIVVLTDSYSNREWCRREVLTAKAAGRPIVVVDAIESQVVRLFPYIGNAPTVRWRAALAEATQPDGRPEAVASRESWEAQDAQTVVLVTLLDALRYLHERARLAASAGPSDLVLGTPPEVVTVTAAGGRTARVLYPDPPLGREELELVSKIHPGVKLTTPLELLARRPARKDFPLIALSLSGAHDIDRFGASDLHLATMAHDVALYLLLGGLRLLYGGVLGHGVVDREGRAPGDDVNYVERLMELVERYSPVARDAGLPIKPIENWVAWPLHEELSEAERDLYRGDRARLTEIQPPDDLGIGPDEFRPGADGKYPADTPLARYVRARCLTAMRKASTRDAVARVVMGGKLRDYVGPLPGVAEEVLVTMRAGKPLYLLGAFGGATRAVIDILRGADREEMTSTWCERHVSGWRDLIGEYGRRRHPAPTPEAAAHELRGRGADGLAAALANGLSDEENDELSVTTDPRRAVELILGGLRVVEPEGL